MNTCPYCRANPCGCGASVFYPELFDDNLPQFDDPDTWIGVTGTYNGVSGSPYARDYSQRFYPESPPFFEMVK